ncbi:endonuclease/exonuclease/phosphatase family protein [Jannaschia sp. LMIT008]|uniref:endonuclease/exonuclease/phosphatase family protein n=1 Tax=Jannaschia maritima TaxID=3032585 RepID=UPI0028128910|nr:endonuclease/exonuclease/phosphatase family protein [Jannaschia sp. LMIT008]
MRLVSWNIRKAVGLDWRRDPARILRALDEMGADVALLQEADRRMPPRRPALPPALVAEHGWAAVGTHPDTPSTGHHGNAILLRPGWTARAVQLIDLPGTEPRGAVAAVVEGPDGPVSVVCAHLGLRRRDRIAQMAMLRPQLAGLGPRALLAGDTNEWRRGPAGLPLPPGWAWHVPLPTFHAARPFLALDRLATGPDLAVTDLRVSRTGSVARASDHLPLLAEVMVCRADRARGSSMFPLDP